MSASLLLSTTALSLLVQDPAAAEPRPDETIPTVVVQTSGAETSHRFGDPLDSGTSTFTQESIEARSPGSGDVNEVLKALPTVQFSSTQGRATRANLQDLRPESISISGGSIYENQFILDGIGSNSRLDVEDPSSPNEINTIAAGTAQTLWVDSSLVGEITVRDSNISAQYGQFTGGVVEIDTRDPARVFGGQIHYGATTSSMASYRMSDFARSDLAGAPPPLTPEFEKERYGISVDLPVSERLRLLAAYNRATSEVTNFPGNLYQAYPERHLRSLSENFLLKGVYDLSGDLSLTGQLTWSPYESEFQHANGLENLVLSNGGGLNGRLMLAGRRGDANWSLQLSHAFADNDREAAPVMYTLSTSAPGLAGCSSGASCSTGSLGPLTQQQHETSLKGVWDQPLDSGRLRLGFDYSHIDAERRRAEPARAYIGTSTAGAQPTLYIGADTVCLEDEGPACVDGAYAVLRYNAYAAFDAAATIDAVSLWGEYDTELAGFRVRLGLRYDHESFLGNHDIAPRLSVSTDLPWAGITVTGGLNRYYGRSFLGYALREGQGATRGYIRTGVLSGGQRLFGDDWVQNFHSDPQRYSNAGLSTPYSDEATLALTGPVGWLGGDYRIKAILRQSRDQFSSSAAESEVIDADTSGTITRRVYTITNEGRRDYEGLSLEYIRSFGANHAISLSANVSHTEASNISYFDVAEETDLEGDLVYYDGAVVPELQALAGNQLEDFAAPWIINADWSASWLGGRLRTNVNARYRSGFERVGDTGQNINIGGVNYDVFARRDYGDSVDVNLSATAVIARTDYGETVLDLRINNLFNSVLDEDYVSSSQPWQLGRNVWASVKHRF